MQIYKKLISNEVQIVPYYNHHRNMCSSDSLQEYETNQFLFPSSMLMLMIMTSNRKQKRSKQYFTSFTEVVNLRYEGVGNFFRLRAVFENFLVLWATLLDKPHNFNMICKEIMWKNFSAGRLQDFGGPYLARGPDFAHPWLGGTSKMKNASKF